MLKKVVAIVLLGICALGASAAAMTLDQALALFQNDNIAVTFTDEGRLQLEDVIGTLRQALGIPNTIDDSHMSDDAVRAFSVDPSQKDLLNKLSQAYYTLGNVFYAEDYVEGFEPLFWRGKNWGFKSLRLNPEFAELEESKGFVAAVQAETDVAALYWSTANWLRVGQQHKLEAAAFWGITDKAPAMSERCLQLSPSYVAGGSYRSLGAYWSGLPGLFGGSADKGLPYLCHVVTEAICSACGDCQPALDRADEYFENRTFIAEFYYIPKKMWAEATAVLQNVLAESIGDKYPLMNAYAQFHAQHLLDTEVGK